MRPILLAAALSLVAAAGCSKSSPAGSTASAAPSAQPAATPSSAPKADDKIPSMTIDQVDQAIAAKQITPVDCNSDRARKRTGVVPGAILLTDDEKYAASELPADKTTKLVFYCANPG